jgi:hypothetical protein
MEARLRILKTASWMHRFRAMMAPVADAGAPRRGVHGLFTTQAQCRVHDVD